jgi:hypothetical protein
MWSDVRSHSLLRVMNVPVETMLSLWLKSQSRAKWKESRSARIIYTDSVCMML